MRWRQERYALGFHRYVNRPWSLFYTTLSSAFLICTEVRSEKCRWEMRKHAMCRWWNIGEPIDKEERVKETRDLEQVIATVLVDNLKWIRKPTEETRKVNEIRKRRQYVDRGEKLPLKLRLKSNHLRLRPKGERDNHRESRAQEPNVEEIMLSGRRNPSASTPRSILKE